MKTDVQESRHDERPSAPADIRTSLLKYTGGLVLSIILTGVSFWASASGVVWAGGLPVLLAAQAIAQMGVHLLMFLHISSGPESANNIMSLAFGVFVVALVIFGSIIIMNNLDGRMNDMPTDSHSAMISLDSHG
ncbi:cytochrome C oxidase subunit IV family protein [Massilia sp. YIM B02763]|uniref:cytochrome o ubiquinol oxidase subunit IV n=1 Tax=Massilia sp. YIM B02763 TaxID=3050130 RepID=UPI0025B68448|nr:cytochrome C oxidase subunit IV family protein [Massilia sp. YIM B02763]MDN4056451.1 cytochrome C oxidase subunit IV family protein [Massilia sp. YIM B02763]